MHAEVISIGDEITSGQLLDTNAQWLGLRLEELGIRVRYHTSVGDQLDAAADAFRAAVRRCDVVLATGGLGPTADDLTREAIAEATGRELILDGEALEHVRGMFARRAREMPARNRQQAMFPAGARMIRNPNGTAPGIDLQVSREGAGPCRVIALPGVPAEIKEMWHHSVADLLAGFGGRRLVMRHKRINCFGAGESHIEAMLPEMIRRGRQPRVGINASRTTIILRITAEGATEEACYAAMGPTIATIRENLGTLVFGEDDDRLQDVVVRALRRRKQTLATVEWGTAGLLAEWLDGVDEAAGCYRGGLVVADKSALKNLLGIEESVLADHSLTGAESARAMAAGCQQRFASDYALAVGAFPEFDTEATEPGTFHCALAGADGVHLKSFPYAGHPATLKVFSAKRALNFVRLALL